MFMSYARRGVCGVVLENCVVGVTLEVLFSRGRAVVALRIRDVGGLVVNGCVVGGNVPRGVVVVVVVLVVAVRVRALVLMSPLLGI